MCEGHSHDGGGHSAIRAGVSSFALGVSDAVVLSSSHVACACSFVTVDLETPLMCRIESSSEQRDIF